MMTTKRPPLVAALLLAAAVLAGVGLGVGSDGWQGLAALHEPALRELLWQVRAPRLAGAWLTGALLALAGAIAQGLFRNPLAEPYLLGSASGASFAVVVWVALGATAAPALGTVGQAGVAFAGAWMGVALTLLLARGAVRGPWLLLAGVVVGVVLAAAAELVTLGAPDALRARQTFVLGSTGFIGWDGVALLAMALAVCGPLARRLARGLDALALGEDTAASLGLPLRRLRAALLALLALATGCAVAQAGLIAFVGLVAPHLVRPHVGGRHAALLPASAAAGGLLLLAADLASRWLLAPRELPVGLLTALLGGAYLLWLLPRRGGTP